ncbi:LytR C-terminal domain-containing protein [Streptacidiphilus sp. MAP12-16]|uniref:LytR C-terminal domain-containing protein n=1 Tax=Streptacidiphilus sp. MAP12-16 TaxID=3156300 RepID=UPI003519099E
MLTPPGLKGKQYRITGTAYPRLRRPNHRRRFILLAVTGVTVLAVLGWGTIQLVDIFGGGAKKATAAARCTRAAAGDSAPRASAPASASASASASAPRASTSAAGAPAAAAASGAAAPSALPGVPLPAAITVNVYNATNHAGLAGQTAALLKQRGFIIGKIGNAPAPLQNKIAGTALVTGGSTSTALMNVVGSEVAGAKPSTDQRKDTSVDLVLGNGFTALATPAQAAQALALATKPSPTASAHC